MTKAARRQRCRQAKLEPHVPTFTTVMQCSTSMVGVFEAAGMLGRAGRSLALVGAYKICVDKIADDRTPDGKINQL